MSVFYDVLMEKSAQKQEQERSTAKGLALGTAGAALGAGASVIGDKALGRASHALYDKVVASDPTAVVDPKTNRSARNAEVAKLLRKLDLNKFDVVTTTGAKEYVETGESPFDDIADLDRTFGIKRDPKTGAPLSPGNAAYYSEAKGGKRGVIFIPAAHDVSPTTVLHELGHGTGSLGRSSKWRKAVIGSSLMGGRASLLGAGAGGASALHAGTREELDRANTINNVAASAAGLVQAPRLLEEARANIRAVGLGKKLGVPARKQELAAAMGTYLAGAAGRTLLPWYANKKIIDHKRNKLMSEVHT